MLFSDMVIIALYLEIKNDGVSSPRTIKEVYAKYRIYPILLLRMSFDKHFLVII